MTGDGKDTIEDRMILQSQLSELQQVPPWVERLASLHSIPADTQFAIDLCLEEVLSNVIRHGYACEPDHSITVQFKVPRENYFVFVIEDHAPPFNPVASPELPPVNSIDDTVAGGQGIRLLRQFANALEYEATPSGNRLSIGFSAAGAAIATS